MKVLIILACIAVASAQQGGRQYTAVFQENKHASTDNTADHAASRSGFTNDGTNVDSFVSHPVGSVAHHGPTPINVPQAVQFQSRTNEPQTITAFQQQPAGFQGSNAQAGKAFTYVNPVVYSIDNQPQHVAIQPSQQHVIQGIQQGQGAEHRSSDASGAPQGFIYTQPQGIQYTQPQGIQYIQQNGFGYPGIVSFDGSQIISTIPIATDSVHRSPQRKGSATPVGQPAVVQQPGQQKIQSHVSQTVPINQYYHVKVADQPAANTIQEQPQIKSISFSPAPLGQIFGSGGVFSAPPPSAYIFNGIKSQEISSIKPVQFQASVIPNFPFVSVSVQDENQGIKY